MRGAHAGVPRTKPVNGLEGGRFATPNDDVVRVAILLPTGKGDAEQ